MPDSRGETDGGLVGVDVPLDVEPAVDEIFELIPEETPEEVIALADHGESEDVTEEAVFAELAEELSTPTTIETDAPETVLDGSTMDDLFGER